jgi:hypothetical protein
MTTTTVVLRGDARAIAELVALASDGVTVYADPHFVGTAMSYAQDRGAAVEVVPSGHRHAALYAALEKPSVLIARCPKHGLHGERTECYVCGGPVEQVAMAELAVQRGGGPRAGVQNSTAPLSGFSPRADDETSAAE